MTRINTNVSSLVAQKTLARTNADLQTAMTRLSTGLRINTGKDDPAGLIASEALRSDIVSTEKAISNSERANQVIATADSALGQVSSLLNDIRGLVTEAANTGALSEDQLAANQLQVDSSLEAINRIATTTTFQGRKLLDGSLDFITRADANFDDVTDLNIQQANLGATGFIDVDITIANAATQAQIDATVPAAAIAVEATAVLTFGEGDTIDLTAVTAGAAANGLQVQIIEDAAVEDGFAIANYDEANSLITVRVDDFWDTDGNIIAAAITGTGVVNAVYNQNLALDTDYSPLFENEPTATLSGGSDAISGLTGDLVFELNGKNGAEVFNFAQDTTGAEIEAAINLVSDATGVTASFAGTTLTLQSSEYGEDAFVAVNVISDAGGFEASLTATRATGTDIEAAVNGVTADGDGNTLSINTATLDLSATIAAGQTDTIEFRITGGGALFQIGPDVVSNQQARIGVGSVSTTSLGGSAGRLYELGSGEAAALNNSPTTAFQIVEQVATKVTSLRGRLGAFQKTTLEANIFTLNETVANLTDAESAIRDADFAAETARLTRAQILVQSGISVLSIANSNPQNVLALLR